MRSLSRFVLGLLALLCAQSSSSAADPVRIRDVRVGFVNGNEDFHKAGAWAPVVVEVENQIIGEEFEGAVVVETADSDGVLTRFSPRRVFIARNERQRTYVTYTKVSGVGADIRVTVKGKVGAQAYEHTFNYPGDRQGGVRASALDSSHKLVLALGDPKGLEPPTAEESAERWDLGRNWHVAFQNNVNLLPDKWFGYEGVDVVVLPTGGTWGGSVARTLANDQLKRLALAQWVEMGGHLVISVSANHSFVGNPQSFPLEPLLPARVETAETIKIERLDKVRELVDSKVPRDRRFRRDSEVRPLADVDVARLHRRQPSLAIATEDNPRLATIVQGSRGMGRVTLLAFDTDEGPFRTWENRRDFWPALLGIKPTQDQGNTQAGFRMGRFGMESVSNDLASQLCRHLEEFGEVKVIPFAWVALFIFIYILIVGPLDYIILKKVVKRLEWTWITFPLVVLGVSVGAFFLAQYLKGNELRINKLDVVEIDTQGNQVYGSTWFTIFSPRLQHYIVGIEPAGFDKKVEEGTVVSWMGRPGNFARGLGRSSGPGLFYRSYEFDNEGQSLKGVPIQVWSMKTFTGRWQAPFNATKPAIVHDLKAERLTLEGSLTSQLPYPLRNCQLVHRKSVWTLGTLEPGKRVPLRDYTSLAILSPSWGPAAAPSRTPRRTAYEEPLTSTSLTALVRQMMFYDELRLKTGQGGASDYLEYLDQSWRLEFPEAVLIGLLDEEDGASNEINERDRPGARLKPFEPRLRGTMRQTTVLRIYLPVTAASANQ